MKWLFSRLKFFFSGGQGGIQVGRTGHVTVHNYFGPPPAPEVPPEVRAMRRSVYEALHQLYDTRPDKHAAVMEFMRREWQTERFMALDNDGLKRLDGYLKAVITNLEK